MIKTAFHHLRRKALLLALALLTLQPSYAGNAYGLPETIQQGVLLHCFDWKYTDITANLVMIANAGFTAVQTSPAQSNYTGTTVWNTLYRPRDSQIGPNTLGTSAELAALCTEAHKLGLKVIVDVVANHTDGGELEWVADFWKNKDLYHTLGAVSNWQDRYQVTHGEIGMKDLKTEDSLVQSKFKEYIAALKAIGVDGCRFDAAKHIGLPSEGDNFWPSVIDPTMFNYGEILDNTGGNDATLLPEYLGYMSITDSPYSTNNVLGAAKNGQATSYGGGNYSFTYNTNKLVYWGESHDTYCNGNGVSAGTSQEVVDRAYAVAASHNRIPALYFSRPTSSSGSSAQAGVMGSTHFTGASVAEVNKFHNAMDGKADYYTANGSVASVTRKDGGALVVNFRGAGQVSIANGGGYVTPGTYTDRVSGNTFTITSSTITGTTNGTGIAVLYNDVVTTPTVTLSQNGGVFKGESLTLTATLAAATSGWVQVDGGQQVSFTDTTTFTIGAETAFGGEVVVNWGATDANGTTATGSVTFVKADPNAKVYVYYNNPNSWSNVSCYLYAGKTNNAWPGVAMTYDATLNINGKSGWWYLEVPATMVNGYAMFTNGQGSGTQQYPGSGQPGIAIDGSSLYVDGTTAGHTTVEPGGTVTPPDPDPSTTLTVYVKADAAPYLYAWTTGGVQLNGTWPGTKMTAQTTVNGVTYYYQSFTDSPVNIIFNNGSGAKTANIMGLTTDAYYSYNGTTGYEQLTVEDTVVIPDPVVEQVIRLSAPVGTYCSSYALDFSGVQGLQAFIASGYRIINGALTIVFTKVSWVPAGTGLFLTGTAGTSYTVPVASFDAGYMNFMVGHTQDATVNPTDGSYSNYVLVSNGTGYQFAPLSSARVIGAGKAYLQLPATVVSFMSAKALNYIFADTTTGISEVEQHRQTADDAYYTPSGIRTTNPGKGLYIRHGRKVVVR